MEPQARKEVGINEEEKEALRGNHVVRRTVSQIWSLCPPIPHGPEHLVPVIHHLTPYPWGLNLGYYRTHQLR